MAHVSLFSSLCTSIPGVAGCAIIAGQFVTRDPVTQVYSHWPGVDGALCGIALNTVQAGEVLQIMTQGVFDGINVAVALPPDNPSIVLPGAAPGSICEQCFDAPALVLRAAPWGGDMGVCLACLVSLGEEA